MLIHTVPWRNAGPNLSISAAFADFSLKFREPPAKEMEPGRIRPFDAQHEHQDLAHTDR